MSPWHEDNQFWKMMEPKLFSRSYWETAEEEVQKIIQLLNIEPGRRILDLGCGPGRHVLELARKGFSVTGVDRTPYYLDQARNSAAEEGLTIELIEADMRTFIRENAFDVILSLYTSFGYFETPDQNQKVLNHTFLNLKTGGKIIIDVMGKEIVARIFRERDWYEQNGRIFLEERKVTNNWSWMENRWTLIENGNRFDFDLSHWLYSASDLKSMLITAGFERVHIYGSMDGNAYDNQAQRLIVVGYK